MACIKISFKSKSLGVHTNLEVVLPDGPAEDIPWVLLLHGLSGNETEWMRYTCCERYACERGFALVMPAADTSWYTDEVYGKKYYTYIAEELPDYVCGILPLSRKREKTFVAGLSMGGYGALKIGLNRPEAFACIASLSGVVDIAHRFAVDDEDKWGVGYEKNAICCWGPDYAGALADRSGNRDNIHSLLKDFDHSRGITPRIFTACATEDRHYKTNLELHRMLLQMPFPHEWHDRPGGHTWEIWEFYIPQVLDYFKKYMEEQKA